MESRAGLSGGGWQTRGYRKNEVSSPKNQRSNRRLQLAASAPAMRGRVSERTAIGSCTRGVMGGLASLTFLVASTTCVVFLGTGLFVSVRPTTSPRPPGGVCGMSDSKCARAAGSASSRSTIPVLQTRLRPSGSHISASQTRRPALRYRYSRVSDTAPPSKEVASNGSKRKHHKE